MKKTKLPVAWLIFLAAVCALAATVLQSARKAEQEFPMAGKNVSQLDTEQILTHIRKAQRCGKNTAFYVNGDNFELQLTADFELTDGGTVRFSIRTARQPTARSCGFSRIRANSL